MGSMVGSPDENRAHPQRTPGPGGDCTEPVEPEGREGRGARGSVAARGRPGEGSRKWPRSLYTARGPRDGWPGARDTASPATARLGRAARARPSRWAARAAAPTPSSSSPSATPRASRVRSASSGRRERARKRTWESVSIESQVSLITTENRGFNVAVGLDVTLPGITEPERAISIVAAAHQVCPYSNATRGNVEVTLKANGRPVPTEA